MIIGPCMDNANYCRVKRPDATTNVLGVFILPVSSLVYDAFLYNQLRENNCSERMT